MKDKAACIKALEDGHTLCLDGDIDFGLLQYDEDGEQYDPVTKKKEKHVVGGEWRFDVPKLWEIYTGEIPCDE